VDAIDTAHGGQVASSRAIVFVSNYLERGSLSTEPRPNQLTDTIRLFACPGEYEPATVSIRAIGELKHVNVALAGDLLSDSGQSMPRTAVEVRLVDPFESWTKTEFEQFLLKTSTVDIKPATTRRFWLTVHVPADARAGTYRSKLVISAAATNGRPDPARRAILKELTYQVQVLPIRLATADETGMAFFMFNNTLYYPHGLLTANYQRRVFEDMREHGMTTATVYLYPRGGEHPGEPPTGFVDTQFKMRHRTDKHLAFAQTMKLLRDTHLIAPGLPIIWLGPEGYDPQVWKTVFDEARAKGWPELLCYAVDEPEQERNDRVRAFMRVFNEFRDRYPHLGARVTTALGSSHGIQTVGHYYDVWIGCMAMRIGESGLIADANMQGKELWVYDCMMAPVDAETDRYYFGVWAWVSGVKGCAHWTYFCQPNLSYVYPTADDLIPSIGWEAVREGIDDYRYLTTLKRLVDRARAVGRHELTKGADEVFEQVTEMVTMDNYGKAYHKATSAKLDTAYQRPRVEPDLPIEAYDRMRLRVAGEIEKLSLALR